MDNLSLELKLIGGNTIYVDEVPIHSVSLAQIAEIGYLKYMSLIKALCISPLDIKTIMDIKVEEDQIFELILLNCLQYPEMLTNYIFILSVITHHPVTFSSDRGAFLLEGLDGDGLNRNNFTEFQKMVKLRNGLLSLEEKEVNPSNQKTEEILEKRNRLRQKIQRNKSQSGSNITLADLVSILAGGLHLELQRVMQYDIYQFHDQFGRLRIFKDYDVSIQTLLHSLGRSDIKIKHWLSKSNAEEAD